MMYKTIYKVRGRGRFPLDMLRYDRSYPATEVDSGLAERGSHHGEERTVAVAHLGDDKRWTPTEARWQSFGWRVVGPAHTGGLR